ncbi:hypothetical protein BYT27DRAFT_7181376 [Phlegmacium glaucopus]|nr:hypothetical protein BYT27DRAFT_7181376 [Phlegmacium glaucopus]
MTKTWLFSIMAIQSDFAMLILIRLSRPFVLALSSPCAAANGLPDMEASFSPPFRPAFDINLRATFPVFFRVFRRHYDYCWLESESESESTFVSHRPAPHLFLSSQFYFFNTTARSGAMAVIMVSRIFVRHEVGFIRGRLSWLGARQTLNLPAETGAISVIRKV